MELLRRVLAAIQNAMGQLNATQKLLIASLVVIAVMALFVVSQYAGSPRFVELMPGASQADQQRAVAFLETAGIRHTQQNGALMVSPESRRTALAALGEAGALPSDTSVLFQNILEKQSWQMSRQQNDQLYTIALQNELARVIGDFRNVRSATVILDVPEAAGLGAVVRKPTASATVFTEDGRALDQGAVDAIATLISGARAGLELSRVRVIDGTSGRQRRATDEREAIAGTYLEHAAKVEQMTREKLQELLGGIPGVIVAVTAQVDVSRVTATLSKNLPLNEGSLSVPRRERTQTDTESGGDAAEPGVRSNQALDINRGSASAVRSNSSEEETEFESHIGTQVENIVDPRGMPTQLAASVAVPRGYMVALVKRSKASAAPAGGAPAPESEPTDAEIETAFAAERTRIEDLLKPHLRTRSGDGVVDEGDVRVSLMPTGGAVTLDPQQAGFIGGGGGGGGGLGVALGDGLIDKAVLALLAAVALGLMFTMVRKSARRVDLPTAEELVGLPPQLESRSDLIGEAGEGESAMTGIEVNEEEVRVQKMLEQVQELVEKNPDSAAKLVNRWLTPDS